MTADRRDEEIRRALAALSAELDRFETTDAPDDLVERTFRRARGQLLAPARHRPEARSILPAGYRRELLRLLALTAPVALLGGGWSAFLWEHLPGWLGVWMPASIAEVATVAWAVSAATIVSLTYGALPFFAHQRAKAKLEEVPS